MSADRNPIVLELETGTYYWCSGGQSENQLFCDAHKETEFAFGAFEITEKQPKAICNCKYTGNPPYCDGSHSKL